MKTLNTIFKLVTLNLIVSITIMGCGPKNVNSNKTPLEDTLKAAVAALVAQPVTHVEFEKIKTLSNDVYGLRNSGGTLTSPKKINPMVNVKAFHNYYSNNNGSYQYQGIRFYPALKNNTLVLLMCLADTLNREEKGFFILEREQYLDSLSIRNGDTINVDSARSWHRQYCTNIELYGAHQNAVPPGSDTIRISRYYDWSDIVRLVSQNILYTIPIHKYFIQFDIGYVDSSMAVALEQRSSIRGIPYHRGFTTLIHIKDSLKTSLMDTLSRYDSSNPNEIFNFYGRALEVGSPCPPVCGDLHMNK